MESLGFLPVFLFFINFLYNKLRFTYTDTAFVLDLVFHREHRAGAEVAVGPWGDMGPVPALICSSTFRNLAFPSCQVEFYPMVHRIFILIKRWMRSVTSLLFVLFCFNHQVVLGTNQHMGELRRGFRCFAFASFDRSAHGGGLGFHFRH